MKTKIALLIASLQLMSPLTSFAQTEAGHGGSYELIGGKYMVKDLFVKPAYEEMTLKPEVLEYIAEIEKIFSSYRSFLGALQTLKSDTTEFRFNPNPNCPVHQAVDFKIYSFGCLTPSGVFYLTEAFNQASFKEKILFLIQEAIFHRYQISEGTYYRVSQVVDLTRELIGLVEQQKSGRRSSLTTDEMKVLNEFYPRVTRLGILLDLKKCEIEPNGGGCVIDVKRKEGQNFVSVGSSALSTTLSGAFILGGSSVEGGEIIRSTINDASEIYKAFVTDSVVDQQSMIGTKLNEDIWHYIPFDYLCVNNVEIDQNSHVSHTSISRAFKISHSVLQNVTAISLASQGSILKNLTLPGNGAAFISSEVDHVLYRGNFLQVKNGKLFDSQVGTWAPESAHPGFIMRIEGISVNGLNVVLQSKKSQKNIDTEFTFNFSQNDMDFTSYGKWNALADQCFLQAFLGNAKEAIFDGTARKSFSFTTAEQFYNETHLK